MEKELCFCIEGRSLYSEAVLVDYMDIPIFFLCKDDFHYYVALCTDINAYNYIVVMASAFEVYDLLHGKMPMRNIILRQSSYWEVLSGMDFSSDIIKRHPIEDLDVTLLPEENACFKVLTDELSQYVCRFDNAFHPEIGYKIFDQTIWLEESSRSKTAFALRMKRYYDIFTHTAQTTLNQETTTVKFDDIYTHSVTRKSVLYQIGQSEDWKYDTTMNMAA